MRTDTDYEMPPVSGWDCILVALEKIMHHPPVTRNRYLVETVLLATRLVNRQNLGVPRIFRALLEEGKEPPAFDEIANSGANSGDTLLNYADSDDTNSPRIPVRSYDLSIKGGKIDIAYNFILIFAIYAQ